MINHSQLYIDHLHDRQIFDLGKKEIPENDMMKLAKLQYLVTKCWKVREI